MSAMPEIPPELEAMLGGQPPAEGPVDPMLDVHAGDPEQTDPNYGPAAPPENETRERVELCILLAIESCAKAVQVGVGATNPDFAMKFGQAAASLGQTYGSLTGTELKEQELGVSAGQAVMQHEQAMAPQQAVTEPQDASQGRQI